MSAPGFQIALTVSVCWLAPACQERPRPGPTPPAPVSSATAAIVSAAAPALGASSASSASAAAATSALTVLERYPAVPKPLSEPCADPRAVLAVRKQFDRSGRLWVQQALLAHPEIELVTDRAQQPGQIGVYETIYGTKNFARLYPGQPLFSEAVVARCADVTTCNRLAAMFRAVAPSERVELICGVPPATTGGFTRVSELSAERRVIPAATGSPPVAICARLHACAVREGTPLPKGFGCSGRVAADLQECAAADSCAKVAACSARLVK